MEQKNDSIIIDIFDEKNEDKNNKNSNSINSIELPTIKRVYQKRKSSIYIPPPSHSLQHKRRTRSFPIESTSRKNRTPQYATPEKKLTPPTKNKINQSNQTKTIKESKYIKKYNSNFSEHKENKENNNIDNIEIDYREYPMQDNINWDLGCIKLPKDCLVYVSQMLIVGTVIGVSLYKLSATTDRPEFWASLLSGSVGYILPNPSLKRKN